MKKMDVACMKKISAFFIVGLLVVLHSGCWVSMPAKGSSALRMNIGKECTLQHDMLIVSYWGTPIAWETDNKDNIGEKQEILRTIKEGAKVQVLSIRSFRLPAGLRYAYRCVDIESDTQFDLDVHMLDYLELSLTE